MNKKRLRFTMILFIITLSLVISGITICKISVIHKSQDNITGEIIGVEQISIPEDESEIKRYIGTTISENKYDFGDTYSSFSDSEKSMEFDISKYNVYKVTAKFQNNSDMPIVITMNTYVKNNQYIVVPSVIPYEEIADNCYESWEYYVFISKDYTKAEIERYLTLQGVDFDVVFQKKYTGSTFVVNCKL